MEEGDREKLVHFGWTRERDILTLLGKVLGINYYLLQKDKNV